MNRAKKRNLKFALLGIVALVAVVMFFPSDSLAEDDSIIFNLPLPEELSFAGQTLSNSNASIECTFKQTTFGIDSTGHVVETKQSKALIGNPLLSLTTISGVKMAGYVVEPKIFCRNTFNDDNLSSPDKFTFVIDSSSLIFQVTSTNKDGSKVGTHSSSFSTKSVSIPVGGNEQSLGMVSVYSSNIEDDLSDGSYGIINQFDLRGNLIVYWKGYTGIKYTIPVKFGDVSSYHNAKIEKGSTGSTTFTGNDKDGDGILDSYDKCIEQPENYNGFEDGNGCPDVSPVTTTTPTTTAPAPIIYTECISKGSTWFMDSTSNTQSYCGGTYNTALGVCGFWDIVTKQCITLKSKVSLPSGDVTLSSGMIVKAGSSEFLSGGVCYQKDMDICVYNKEKALGSVSPTSTSTSTGLSGKILWTGEIKYSDTTTGTFTVSDDSTPFKFTIPLQSLIGGTSGVSKEISTLTLHPVLKMDSPDIHKQISTKSSGMLYTVIINKLASSTTVVPNSALPDFRPSSGSTYPSGISLGNIVIRMNEIEAKIPASVVGINESADIQLVVNLSGTLGVDYINNNVVKPLSIKIVKSTTDNNSGDTQFFWNVKIQRGTGGGEVCDGDLINGECVPKKPQTEAECMALNTSNVKYVWLNNTCVVINDNVQGEQECIASGGTWTSGVCVPNKGGATEGGMCKLDLGAGDSNGDGAICQICIDDKSGVGGFPCDEPYRVDYCGGTTKCGTSNPESNSPPKCNDLFADLTNGCIAVGSTCPVNFTPFVKGLELQCNPSVLVGGNPLLDECPDNASCAIDKGESPSSTGGSVCLGASCLPPSILSDPNLIWYLAGGILFIVIIAVVAKKKR